MIICTDRRKIYHIHKRRHTHTNSDVYKGTGEKLIYYKHKYVSSSKSSYIHVSTLTFGLWENIVRYEIFKATTIYIVIFVF
jgi:hypothetical protein